MASMFSTNILVVDDEPDTPMLYNQKFKKEIEGGIYNFTFCKDGYSALEIAQEKNNVHVLVTDINIPGLGGIDLVNRVSTFNTTVPCIVISAYGNISLIRSAMRAGAHDFLIKPTDFNDLAETIQKSSLVAHERRKNEEMYRRLAAITDELDVSARLQKSILPGNVLKKDGVEVYANTHPAAEVGGDFYDFFWLNDHQLGVVMADVSGKNVSAALFMTMSRTLIKSIAPFASSPADCFTRVNDELMKENVTTMFVTAIYGIFDLHTKVFTYTNAGHLPVALMNSKRGVEFLDCDPGIALGIADCIEFSDNSVELVPGDMFLLYTDGVTEANDINGAEYDMPRLEECLQANAHLSPHPLTDELIKSIKGFTKTAPQSDDITTLCLKYRSKVSQK